MRPSTLLLAAALLTPALSRAAQVAETSAIPQVRLAAAPVDLAPLAVRLRASIPTIRALDLSVAAPNAGGTASPGLAAAPAEARVVPAIFATARAEALLGRLAQAGAIEPRRPAEAAEPADAKKTMSAVNAVLKDFSPERIAALPQEDVSALAGLLFDHMGAARPADRAQDARAAAVLSEASARKMLAQRGEPMRETVLNPGHNETHPDDVDVRGVPSSVKPVETDGAIWRHYTTKEGYEAIVKSGTLQNGYVSYVQLAPGVFKKLFKDVTGLFLTKPGVDGAEVGVPDSQYPHYVDVVLPAAVKILEIEAGRIWLVPLPSRPRAWIAEEYRRWADGGEAKTLYRKSHTDMDAAGGPGPDVAVPVEIVGEGRAQ